MAAAPEYVIHMADLCGMAARTIGDQINTLPRCKDVGRHARRFKDY
jgi:hypothetical protein